MAEKVHVILGKFFSEIFFRQLTSFSDNYWMHEGQSSSGVDAIKKFTPSLEIPYLGGVRGG